LVSGGNTGHQTPGIAFSKVLSILTLLYSK
jgi:hypothetical protein